MRPQPTVRPISYSIRRAYDADAFVQFPLLGADRFGREAKRRDANLSMGSSLRDRLEELDEVGALRPVLFELDGGKCVFREDTDYVPWERYSADEDGFKRPRPYYAYWQLLYVHESIEFGVARVDVDWLLDDEKGRQVGDGARSFYGLQGEIWRELDDRWRASVLLLTRIQNKYGPPIKGGLGRSRSTMVFDAEAGEHVDPYIDERRSFDAAEVLAALDLDLPAVKEIHERVAIHGVGADPNGKWYMLFRMASFTERDKLEGSARRAQDAYDAAEMIRSFYYDLTGDLLLNPDEIFDVSDKSWKQHIFGEWPTRNFTRLDLQAELRRHDLWPHQVHMIVEGETEEVVCRRLIVDLTGVEPERIGITFTQLRGVGKLRLHQEVLRLTKAFARWPVLVVDREGDVERDVAIMKREGLLSDETAVLWDSTFEEQHFTDDELVEVVLQLGGQRGVELALTAQEFRAAYDDHRSRAGADARGAATYLLGLAANPDRGGVRITKSEFGERLALRLLEDLDNRGDQAVEERRILGLIMSILRVA